jgi:hypothetical protein
MLKWSHVKPFSAKIAGGCCASGSMLGPNMVYYRACTVHSLHLCSIVNCSNVVEWYLECQFFFANAKLRLVDGTRIRGENNGRCMTFVDDSGPGRSQ